MAFEMKDRLDQLRRSSNYPWDDFFATDEEDPEEEEEEFLLDFFHTIDELTMSVNEISLLVEKIHENHTVILASIQNHEAKDENNQLTDEVKQLSHKIQAGLKRIQKDITTEEIAMEQETYRTTADLRIKKAQYATLARRFKDVMAEYNQTQDNYRERSKSHIQRQLSYTGKHVTEEEVEEILESDNTTVLTQDLSIDTSLKREALREIEARHLEILIMEQNIRELHEMFYDLAVLVEEQGELIDRIEHNVENTAEYVERGKKQIRTAAHYKKRRRGLFCCCVVL